MNLPNKISLLRICLIPVFVLFFFLNAIPYNQVIAAIIFAVAACTDYLDGYIARSKKLVTNLGKFLDPIADKCLVATAFILMLTIPEMFTAYGHWGYVTAAICICIILARELIISAFRQIAAANGIVLAAEMIGKYKTLFQDICVFALILSVDFLGSTFGKVVNIIGLVTFAIATVLTIWSGFSYVLKNRIVLKEQK